MKPSQVDTVISTWLNLGVANNCSISTLSRVTPVDIAVYCTKNNHPMKPNKAMKILRELGFDVLNDRIFGNDSDFEERLIKTIRMFGTDAQINHYLEGSEKNDS
ncbi:MAG: hypothetical protein KRP56_03025 [Candidatus Methanogranum gryphiswaldense]|nr:MAG: hypothetical protein KRP56_03025 [Candidatus Methanogranum sp. U3.2.1]